MKTTSTPLASSDDLRVDRVAPAAALAAPTAAHGHVDGATAGKHHHSAASTAPHTDPATCGPQAKCGALQCPRHLVVLGIPRPSDDAIDAWADPRGPDTATTMLSCEEVTPFTLLLLMLWLRGPDTWTGVPSASWTRRSACIASDASSRAPRASAWASCSAPATPCEAARLASTPVCKTREVGTCGRVSHLDRGPDKPANGPAEQAAPEERREGLGIRGRRPLPLRLHTVHPAA